jgi:XTP/dITP diphosphohydrolase
MARMKLVFATNNAHKLEEIRRLIGNHIELLSLDDIGCYEEIPEDQPTLEGNAMQKALYVFDRYQLSCFADDTGLEIDSLGGEPGVFSARYAGPGKDSVANMQKVLAKMSKINHRNARFRTVISLIINGTATFFEGVVEGVILYEHRGGNGFGYDPIFKPDESERSFAEMTLNEKNRISHRARAVGKLVDYLAAQSANEN